MMSGNSQAPTTASTPAVDNNRNVINTPEATRQRAEDQPKGWCYNGGWGRIVLMHLTAWICSGLILLILFLTLPEVELRARRFSLLDESLSQHYIEAERFGTVETALICVLVTGFIFFCLGVEDIIRHKNKTRDVEQGQTSMPVRSRWYGALRAYMWFSGFMISLLLSVCTQLTAQQIFQRFRPDFIERCFGPSGPSQAFIQSHAPLYLAYNTECPNWSTTDKIFREGHLSFMSGHSATVSIMCTWISLALYYRFIYRRGTVSNIVTQNINHSRSLTASNLLPWRTLVIFFPWLFAFGLSGTRNSDHRHHMLDIITSTVVGTLTALIVYYVFIRTNYEIANDAVVTNVNQNNNGINNYNDDMLLRKQANLTHRGYNNNNNGPALDDPMLGKRQFDYPALDNNNQSNISTQPNSVSNTPSQRQNQILNNNNNNTNNQHHHTVDIPHNYVNSGEPVAIQERLIDSGRV